jgi:hypothetical protein
MMGYAGAYLRWQQNEQVSGANLIRTRHFTRR